MRSVSFTTATLLAAAAFFGLGPAATGQASYDLGDAKHLKVLYAGVPDTSRARVFMEFLKANFDTVDEIDVTMLSKESAAPFDVVVCDGKRLYPMDPKKPGL